jgi:diaminohydroxyphosphoribosylaminopyrimidine deaminase / 5-amino-6-(5-phosphoribosylamino)uracil reductase
MEENKEQQLFFMRWAIQLGEKGRCTAPPNPWVGCVIVRNGEILAEGYHEAAGKKHAEVVALEKAGALARGATAYVTLEPCPHQGRTPPCVNALIEAGIQKVVIPFLDPDPSVCGKGVEKLKKAGIEVVVGLGQKEAESSLAPYLYQRLAKRPFCVLKAAISLDGRIAATDGSSQWITGEKAREDLHLLRAQSQAILVGARTAHCDSPRLTVRGVGLDKQPLRVLLDPQGSVAVQGPLADMSLAPTLVFTSSEQQKQRWEECGAEVIVQQTSSLQQILEELGKRGVIQALVEGGGRVYASFLKENLVNRVVLYLGNCLLGDQGKPFLPDFLIPNISHAPRWTLEGMHRFDSDIRLDFATGVIYEREAEVGSQGHG